MTLNFAMKAEQALNRTRLEMEAGGQGSRTATAVGREKKVRPRKRAKRADDDYPEG